MTPSQLYGVLKRAETGYTDRRLLDNNLRVLNG